MHVRMYVCIYIFVAHLGKTGSAGDEGELDRRRENVRARRLLIEQQETGLNRKTVRGVLGAASRKAWRGRRRVAVANKRTQQRSYAIDCLQISRHSIHDEIARNRKNLMIDEYGDVH